MNKCVYPPGKPAQASYLSTGVVEGGEGEQGLALGVEGDDVLENGVVLSPVQRLEVVGSHYVNILLPGYASKVDDLLGVPRLE